MKKYTILFIILLICLMNNSRAQNGINFQGVARDNKNLLIASQIISVKLSVLQGNTESFIEYSETRKVMTNPQGLFTVVIGDNDALSTFGNFNTINWKLVPKSLKIEIDPAGGDNFITMGTTQFQYVPYAKYASSVDAENIIGTIPIVSGGTGVKNLLDFKKDLQIDKINNTADLTKPINNLTQDALDSKLNLSEIFNYTKKSYVDSASHTKLDIVDTFLMLSNRIGRDTVSLSNRIVNKLNISDTLGMLSNYNTRINNLTTNVSSNTASFTNTTSALLLKAPSSSPIFTGIPIAPTAPSGTNTNQIATTSFVANAVSSIGNVTGVTITDADVNTKGKIQLAGDLGGTASAPTVPALALKANANSLTDEIIRATNAENLLSSNINSNTASVTSEITRATNAENLLSTNINSNTASITSEITRATNAENLLSSNINSNTVSITSEITRATNAENLLSTNINSNTASITSEITRATNAENLLSTNINSNTASVTSEITRATNAENLLSTKINSNTASITAIINTPITYLSLTGTVPTWNQNTTGNAATATSAITAGTASASAKLITPRNINGVAFDGTADITVTADAGTLTGTTLKSTVTSSSLTSVGTLVSLDVNGRATNSSAFNATTSTTIDFTKSNLAYTSNSPGAFILSGIKDGGTFTLAVQGTTSGTSTFTSNGFTFLSVNNGVTSSGKHTLYTFIVMGTFVYFFMTAGF